MTDTWNDRDDYETSALDSRDLFEQMQRDWTWPAPRDAGARDLDGLTLLERAEMERDMAQDALDRAQHDLERVREYLRRMAR